MASGRDHTLDGLRAVAVTLVVLHHTITQPIVDGLVRHHLAPIARLVSSTTASGVELFFVLSGILLLGPYVPRAGANRGQSTSFEWLPYVRRRIERLWPPYLIALLFAAGVVAFTTIRPTWYARSVLPRFSVVDVIHQLGIVNFGWVSYNGAWWSLTVEIFFYVSLPVAVFLICRSGRLSSRTTTLILLTTLLAALVAFPLRPRVTSPNLGGQLVVFVLYLPCFALGGLVGGRRMSGRVAAVMAIFGAVVIGTSVFATSVSPIPGFALLYTALISELKSGREHHQVAAALTAPASVWVGERSYSMFLVHFSVLYLLSHAASFAFTSRTAGYFVLTRALAAPAIVVVTIFVFGIAEKPFARGLVTAGARWPWQTDRIFLARRVRDVTWGE